MCLRARALALELELDIALALALAITLVRLCACARCKAPVISPALFVGWWARITFFYNLRFDDALISDLTIDPA